MTVDEIAKLVLVFSVSFAIVGLAVQSMRLIGKLVDALEDLRGPIKTFSDLADYLLRDYGHLRKVGGEMLSEISEVKDSVLTPLRGLSKALWALKRLSSWLDKED